MAVRYADPRMQEKREQWELMVKEKEAAQEAARAQKKCEADEPEQPAPMDETLLFGKVPIRPAPRKYAHSSLCLLDAVYSIHAKYLSVRTDAGKGIIWRYCRCFGIEPYQRGQNGEDSLSLLSIRIDERGPERFAREVLVNESKVKVGGGLYALKSHITSQVADRRRIQCITHCEVRTSETGRREQL